MSFSFGTQKNDPIYGTYGEFTVGPEHNQIRAHYLLTKVKPGSEGSWENLLASQMVPWREVFNIEEITFDELLQRDLDDSRVAHDMIPYLLGDKEASARFFPPILAVLVPKNVEGSGIQPLYPEVKAENLTQSYGDLFDFNIYTDGEQITPWGSIKYNRQKVSFIIVDGQHRAMAILALHRQLNASWGSDRYAAYYAHLDVTAEQIRHIELSVCVLFFPDLHEGNQALKDLGIDLNKVCREIFLIVNKTAKKVSQSRELLLDDVDLAARMMRDTLSKLKGRGEAEASLSRIYSIAFGDSDADTAKAVVAGRLEYSSAVALHKMHSAVCFMDQVAYSFESPSDITDLRRARNNTRAANILIGTELQKWPSLSRLSGKSHPPAEIEEATELLSEIADIPILSLFDRFRAFVVHNTVMRRLRTRLLDPSVRSNIIQSKCYSLLFEGSGVRNVFEDHVRRLSEREEELKLSGEKVSDYITHQLNDAKAVEAALAKHEQDTKNERAALFFNIDGEKFFSAEDNDNDRKELLNAARPIFDTVSTQAFQLGFLMAVHSVVELMVDPGVEYERRLNIIRFVTDLYLNTLNRYFAPTSSNEHRTLTGLVKEPRSRVFDQNSTGLRGLLHESLREINEKQWVFFRYAILEMVHSKHGHAAILEGLEGVDDRSLADMYRQHLPALMQHVVKLRNHYVTSAIRVAVESNDFQMELERIRARALGEGKSAEDAEALVKKEVVALETKVRDRANEHLRASLGEVAKPEKLANRLVPAAGTEGAQAVTDESSQEDAAAAAPPGGSSVQVDNQ
jgi:hypothetical protein